MKVQANKPVSPLSVMAQHRRYVEYTQGARKQADAQGVNLSRQTVQRVAQETVEAVIRNMGDFIVP